MLESSTAGSSGTRVLCHGATCPVEFKPTLRQRLFISKGLPVFHAPACRLKNRRIKQGTRRIAATKAKDAESWLAGLQEIDALYPPLPDTPNITVQSCIVASCWHCPFHHVESVEFLCEVAKAKGITDLVIGGDFFDIYGLSRFRTYQTKPTLVEELVAGAKLVKLLAQRFKRIHMMPGNHDLRIAKTFYDLSRTATGKQMLEVLQRVIDVPPGLEALDVSAWQLVEFVVANPALTVYRYPTLTINKSWLVIHPKAYSRNPPTTEKTLAAIHRMNVIGCGSHLTGVAFDASGRDVVASLGCMADFRKLEYQRVEPSTHPRQSNSFAVLQVTDDAPEGWLQVMSTTNRKFTSHSFLAQG